MLFMSKKTDRPKTGFWLNVKKFRGNGCWEWVGSRTRVRGYGLAKLKGYHSCMAHRISYEIVNGPIPTGKLILHKCDNPPCVRPSHLCLGTQKDNMRDMWQKGRGPSGSRNGSQTKPHRRAWGDRNGTRTCPETRERGDDHWTRRTPSLVLRGERNGHAKLTVNQVKRIRRLYLSGAYHQSQLADIYKVSQVQISRITRGVHW